MLLDTAGTLPQWQSQTETGAASSETAVAACLYTTHWALLKQPDNQKIPSPEVIQSRFGIPFFAGEVMFGGIGGRAGAVQAVAEGDPIPISPVVEHLELGHAVEGQMRAGRLSSRRRLRPQTPYRLDRLP